MVKEPEEEDLDVGIDYYYGEEEFDRELDYPCRDLLKLIAHK